MIVNPIFAEGVPGQRIVFRSPVPTVGGLTLTFHHPTLGDVSVALAAVQAAVSVTGTSSDLRKLTDSGAALASGFAITGAEWGQAVYISNDIGEVSVVVGSVDLPTIYLADPLPRASAAGTLYWRMWTAAMPDALVADAQRAIPYSITTPDVIAGATLTASALRGGTVSVVRQPFTTGCTTADVLAVIPQSPGSPHRRQNDYEPQIRLAHAELVARLRALLAERGLDEHNLFDPSGLRVAHATLAAAWVQQEGDQQRGELYRGLVLGAQQADGTRRGGMLTDIVSAIPIDKDDDGVVDEGEAAAALSGAPTSYPTYYQDRQADSDTERTFANPRRMGW